MKRKLLRKGEEGLGLGFGEKGNERRAERRGEEEVEGEEVWGKRRERKRVCVLVIMGRCVGV